MSKRTKMAPVKLDVDPNAQLDHETHRTAEYQDGRARELVQQAGEELKITQSRMAAVDWSQAPDWASGYRVALRTPRDDATGLDASTMVGSWMAPDGTFEAAPVFFAVEPGEVAVINKDDSVVVQRAPLTGLVDARPGANPVAANVNGYRKLSDQELALVNEIKAMERQVGDLWRRLSFHTDLDLDLSWLGISSRDLQRGFMAMVRAVAKPESAF